MKPPLGRLFAAVGPLALTLAAANAGGQPPPSPTETEPPRKARVAPPRALPKPVPRVLEGVVKGPDGKPVEGARVTFRAADGSSDALPRTLTTDAAGRFRAELRGSSRLDLRVDARGFAGRSLEGARPGAPLTIVLDRGRTLEGTVRDAAGQPVPGARVEARASTGMFLPWDPQAGVAAAATDARGRYRIEGIEPSLLNLRASAAGVGTASRSNVRAGRRVDLVLGPGSGLSGTVLDPDGRPVRGAVVRAEGVPWGGGETVVTDAQGRYQMPLSAGTFAVIVRHPDFAPAVVSDVTIGAEGEREEPVSLEAGAEVTGRLVGAEERPVSGTVVLVQWGEHQAPASLVEVVRGEAGDDGRFRLPPLAAGRYVFDAKSPGRGRRRFDVASAGQENTLDVGDVLIEPGLAIRGHVLTRAGTPVPEAVVTASREHRSFSGFVDEETRSQADGSFLLGGLAAGSYGLRSRAAGYTSARGEAVAGAEGVDLRVDAAGILTGLVVEEGDRPVEGYHLQAQPMGSDERRRWESEHSKTVGTPDGRFLLEDVAAGSYVVRVIVPDRAPATVSGVKVAEGQTTDLGTIRVPRGGVVRGLVADAAGGPVTGARITVSLGEMDILTWWGLLSDHSDATGAFEVRGVPAGSALVKAVHPSYAPGRVAVEVDPAKGPAEARLLLRQGGRIEGTARRRDGQPLTGQTIMMGFSDAGGMDTPFPTTGADGSFVVEHVPPGHVTLTLMAAVGPGRFVSSLTREIDVVDGQTTSVELTSRDILVSGRVTRNRSPAPGVELTFQSERGYAVMGGPFGASAPPTEGPRRNEATTREDGSFELIVGEPGRYSVSARVGAPRLNFPWRPVEIPDAEAFGLELDYSGVPVSGLVVARETQEAIAQASVSANPKEPRQGEGGVGAATGPDGRFELQAPPGEYRLSAQAQGYAAVQQPLSVGESGVTDLRIELERGLEILGRVVNAAGQGVPSVQILALGPGDPHTRPRGYAQARGDGSFALGSLREAPYNLCAGSEIAGFAIRAGVKPGARDVTLTLRPGGRVRLRVLGADNAPFKDAFPQVRRVNGVEVQVPVYAGRPTDTSGQTEVTVPAGSLELRVGHEKASGRTTVEVAGGQTIEAEIRMTDPPERP